jgi:hypothetical protein
MMKSLVEKEDLDAIYATMSNLIGRVNSLEQTRDTGSHGVLVKRVESLEKQSKKHFAAGDAIIGRLQRLEDKVADIIVGYPAQPRNEDIPANISHLFDELQNEIRRLI